MSAREIKSTSPAWLEYSGLPELLAQKTKNGAAWLLFKKIVELDCERNSMPGTVEISYQELQLRTGLAASSIEGLAGKLRKQKLIACFLPDNDEESALFRVVTPLTTPLSIERILETYPDVFAESASLYFRYVSESSTASGENDDDLSGDNTDLKQVVDWYFDTVGLKMNVFILDELRMLPQKFPMDEIRRTFARARKNEIRSLYWVIQQLVRGKKKADEKNAPAETPFADVVDTDDDIRF